MVEKTCSVILISDSCPRSGDFRVGSALDTEHDRYTAEISHCKHRLLITWPCFCFLARQTYRQNSFAILATV